MRIPVNKSRIPAEVSYFDDIFSIDIEKEDLFKLGIFKHEVPPEHVRDSDYIYLMSKVSAYIQLYSDFITIDGNSIINTSKDDRVMKDVSEIVGIALGLKLTIDCFDIRQERIAKIPPPNNKKKYLDYRFQKNNGIFELETKGTTSKNIKRFVDDISAKKADSTDTHFRFGTVSVLSKPGKDHHTELHLCDDPPIQINELKDDDDTPWHYISTLGHILDNKYYNKLVLNFIHGDTPKNNFIQIKERFFGRYIFNGEPYFGEFFDYRLNIENISAIMTKKKQTVDDIFRKVTRAQGKKKIFIGVNSQIVDLITNGFGLKRILELQFSRIKETTNKGLEILRDSDGVIVVISPNKTDHQFDYQFPEDEVKNRIGQLVRLERHEPTECGSPCRSREKEGKPCEIKTYRGTCHFHR